MGRKNSKRGEGLKRWMAQRGTGSGKWRLGRHDGCVPLAFSRLFGCFPAFLTLVYTGSRDLSGDDEGQENGPKSERSPLPHPNCTMRMHMTWLDLRLTVREPQVRNAHAHRPCRAPWNQSSPPSRSPQRTTPALQRRTLRQP
jgi:hypothetical protein